MAVNVSTGKGTRYLAEVTAFRDENTGASEKPIQIARKNMRLLAESENREGSSVLRITNVERTPAGTFQLNPRFIPPLIEIGASEYLVGLLRGLVELLSARSTQLSASRLGSIFSELDEKLRALLETVVPTNLVSLPLKLVQNSIYTTAVDHDKYQQNTRMYLALSAETSEETIIQKVPQQVKACSATRIDHLVRLALPGIQLRHLTSPPSAIPVNK